MKTFSNLKALAIALGLLVIGAAAALSQGQGILTTLNGSYLVPIQTPGAVNTATTLDSLATFIQGGSGFQIVRGETALDGTNPTPVATGLTTIAACSLSVKVAATPGTSTSMVTYDTTAGTMNMYGWMPTNTTTTTLVASTGTQTVGWVCVGS